MKVAAVQAAFGIAQTGRNLETMRRLGSQAAGEGADVVVFPELCLSGYSTDVEVPGFGEGADMATAILLAKELGVAIVAGFPEREGDALYNSAALIDGRGNVLSVRRKRLLWVPERAGYTAGPAEVHIASIGELRCGLLICYEAEFPEYARAVCAAGADVMLVPTATAEIGPQGRFSEMVIGARATENNAYIVYANHIGPTEDGESFMGRSIIAGPNASVLAAAGPTDEAILLAEIDVAGLTVQRGRLPYLDDIARWPPTD